MKAKKRATKKTKAVSKKKVARKPGDHGLQGNTGISTYAGTMIHLNMPYDANSDDTVFVGDYSTMSWERMTKAQAKKKELTPLKCSYCTEPATRLDHSWPYMRGMTSCKKHLERYDAD